MVDPEEESQDVQDRIEESGDAERGAETRGDPSEPGEDSPGPENDGKDAAEVVEENLERGQSRLHSITEASKGAARTRERFHERDEEEVENIWQQAKDASERIGENQRQFEELMDELNAEVAEEKTDFEEETVPAWLETVVYDEEAVDRKLGERHGEQPSTEDILDEDFQDAVMDSGYFTASMKTFNNLVEMKKGLSGEVNEADGEIAENRGQKAARRDDQLDSVIEHLKNQEVGWTVDEIGIETQVENLVERRERYDEIREATEEAIREWDETRDASEPDVPGTAAGAIRDLLGLAAEETGGEEEFGSREEELAHRDALLAFRGIAASAVEEQASRVERSVERLEILDEQLGSREDMYRSVVEGVENLDAVDQVGESSAEILEEQGMETVLDIAFLEGPEDLKHAVPDFSYEANGNDESHVRNNAGTIYDSAREVAVDLAEQWGLNESTEMIDDFSDDSYEEGALKQLAGVYIQSEKALGAISDLEDMVPETDEYRETLDEIGEYIGAEREEVAELLNEYREAGEQLEVPDAEEVFDFAEYEAGLQEE